MFSSEFKPFSRSLLVVVSLLAAGIAGGCARANESGGGGGGGQGTPAPSVAAPQQAPSAGVVGEAKLESFRTGASSIYFYVPDSVPVRVQTGSVLRLDLRARANAQAEIDQYLAATSQDYLSDRLLVVVGPRERRCEILQRDGVITEIVGVCVESWLLTVPHGFSTPVYLNGRRVSAE